MGDAGKHSLRAVAISDTGLVRTRNEDGVWMGGRFLRDGVAAAEFSAADLAAGVFLAVADGVGGEAAGDVASRFVLEKLASLMAEAPVDRTPAGFRGWLEQSAAAVNDALRERAEGSPGLSGMATTLTGVHLRGDGGFWLNAGDSRLYAYADGALRQVSRDHTLREVSGNPNIPGNIIVNCFGIADRFHLDTGELPDAELYLLCSDGLSDYAPRALSGIVSQCAGCPDEQRLVEAARRLVDAAMSGGGGDNITAVLIAPQYL